MQEYTKTPGTAFRTPDNSPRASRQAPVSVILQQYRENTRRYAPEEESVQQGETSHTTTPSSNGSLVVQRRDPSDRTIRPGELLTHGTSIKEFLIDRNDKSKGNKETPDGPAWFGEGADSEAFNVHAAIRKNEYFHLAPGNNSSLFVYQYKVNDPDQTSLNPGLHLAGWNNWYQAVHYIHREKRFRLWLTNPKELTGWNVDENEKKQPLM